MRFLADESCDFAVVRTLRQAGHDVLAIREVSPRAEDSVVADRAHREERVLLTEDKDFGQLVRASGSAPSGVIYLRLVARKAAFRRVSSPQAHPSPFLDASGLAGLH